MSNEGVIREDRGVLAEKTPGGKQLRFRSTGLNKRCYGCIVHPRAENTTISRRSFTHTKQSSRRTMGTDGANPEGPDRGKRKKKKEVNAKV